MDPWFLIHFRKGSTFAHGEAERDRILARKVPKVVHVEDVRVHTCSACGKAAPWERHDISAGFSIKQAGWCWYGSEQALETGQPIEKFCSMTCRETRKPDKRRPKDKIWQEWPRTSWYEPRGSFDGGSWKLLYDARRALNPRLFPMPVWPKGKNGGGWCRWCGDQITGPRAKSRNWHRYSHGDGRNCFQEWVLHTDLDAQRQFLIERDGPGCACCQRDDGGWVDNGAFSKWMGEGNWIKWSIVLEVDHVVELWSVLGLPDDQRRWFFGPDNLWLICTDCHRAKSARAAAERAAARS